MLANLLAVIVALGSLGFYLVAFILPEVHRRSDFFWSGVGMFYAVVLWYCNQQMNGAVLLGQTASVGLLLWFGYQTLRLRREITPPGQQTPIQLGKVERNRLNGNINRPIAKDYEFVEDGVDDNVDQEPDPDRPILIKPTADEFAPKIVVPAAIPKPNSETNIETDSAEESPLATATSPPQNVQAKAKPNPIEAVGIFVGWLKDVVTPKKKAPKPMIELPPRPPSIPKSDSPKSNQPLKDNNLSTTKPATSEQLEPNLASDDDSSSASPKISTIKNETNPEDISTITTPSQAHDDDEDSNWPDDDFWD